ncbi:hypothetical protein KSC_048070 [Ktedonobacter sp. SOSP1-52]|uniref:hypothetical protein n=1 Tax=Ktedonobacter sp. SOSP1-52 TaxID=2778366 RepID=UPI0019166129|nr:hypothetical protein [Ktedonobacter sp. SOSP1-52]GHO65915.1 hypothetical protein KSC_048070 [Ktedonobacter sp. SOSP1-52]
MRCEDCGTEIANHTTTCPTCGAHLEPRQRRVSASTQYNQREFEATLNAVASYEEGYQEQPYEEKIVPPRIPRAEARSYGYGPSDPRHRSYPGHQTAYTYITYQAQPIPTLPRKNDGALIIEIFLSLFGVFGVGWLTAGKTSVGLALLLGSIFIYWPVVILGTIFTFGIGLLCLGPLAILAIIINAILLNGMLNRQLAQAQYVAYTQQPPMQTPPPFMHK